MPDFQYKASVIVPVYNVEKYLRGCIESLVGQTMDFSEVEVLLINDGSPDGSEAICREYAEKYSNVVLYSKQNEGLSKTRNYGLSRARGKYIFYLDSDDTLRNDTLKSVTDFFDSVYDEVDLVTYRIIQYFQGRPNVVHYRYNTLVKSGVYDLTDPKNRYITQTNINVCVKNMGERSIFFDATPNFRHEDEKYCCDVLRRKMKIGFCSSGEYVYNRNNVMSIVSTQFSPENIFESSTAFYEELLASFGSAVPQYYQGIVFNDFRWKLKDGKFLPTHLEGAELARANRRINDLLRAIDEDVIVLHPSVSEEHLHYWLKRKPDSHPIVTANDDSVSIYCSGRCLCRKAKFRASVKQTEIGAEVTVSSPVFFHLNRAAFEIYNGETRTELEFDENSTDIDGFMPSFKIKDAENLNLSIEIYGKKYPI